MKKPMRISKDTIVDMCDISKIHIGEEDIFMWEKGENSARYTLDEFMKTAIELLKFKLLEKEDSIPQHLRSQYRDWKSDGSYDLGFYDNTQKELHNKLSLELMELNKAIEEVRKGMKKIEECERLKDCISEIMSIMVK